MRYLIFLIALAAGAVDKTEFDVLVQGAVDFELQPLLTALEGKTEVHYGSWTYWTGHIGKASVVVSKTNMGPINAAGATMLGIEHFHPRAIINQGTAGAHDPKLRVYDLVLGEKTTDYSAFSSAHGDAGAGVDPARWTPAYHELGGVTYRGFAGDPKLLAVAATIPYTHGKIVKGNIGSAYQYNRELDRIASMRKLYGTDSEDMESVYSAGIAAAMHVPFLAVRIISDSEWNHPKLERDSGEYCAKFTVELIKVLGLTEP